MQEADCPFVEFLIPYRKSKIVYHERFPGNPALTDAKKKKTDRTHLSASLRLYLRSNPLRLLSTIPEPAVSRLLSNFVNIPLPILYSQRLV